MAHEKLEHVRHLLRELTEPLYTDSPFRRFVRDSENRTLGFDEFVKRINTFKPEHWVVDPNAAVFLAKHGWENNTEYTVSCGHCKVVLECTPFLKKTDVLKVVGRRSHASGCRWTCTSTPTHYFKIPRHPLTVFNNLKHSWESLQNMDKNLPLISKQILDSMGITDDFIKTVIKSFNGTVNNAAISALVLGLCGWSRHSESYVRCSFCQRVIGLWNFHSVSDDGAGRQQPPLPDRKANHIIAVLYSKIRENVSESCPVACTKDTGETIKISELQEEEGNKPCDGSVDHCDCSFSEQEQPDQVNMFIAKRKRNAIRKLTTVKRRKEIYKKLLCQIRMPSHLADASDLDNSRTLCTDQLIGMDKCNNGTSQNDACDTVRSEIEMRGSISPVGEKETSDYTSSINESSSSDVSKIEMERTPIPEKEQNGVAEIISNSDDLIPKKEENSLGTVKFSSLKTPASKELCKSTNSRYEEKCEEALPSQRGGAKQPLGSSGCGKEEDAVEAIGAKSAGALGAGKHVNNEAAEGEEHSSSLSGDEDRQSVENLFVIDTVGDHRDSGVENVNSEDSDCATNSDRGGHKSSLQIPIYERAKDRSANQKCKGHDTNLLTPSSDSEDSQTNNNGTQSVSADDFIKIDVRSNEVERNCKENVSKKLKIHVNTQTFKRSSFRLQNGDLPQSPKSVDVSSGLDKFAVTVNGVREKNAMDVDECSSVMMSDAGIENKEESPDQTESEVTMDCKEKIEAKPPDNSTQCEEGDSQGSGCIERHDTKSDMLHSVPTEVQDKENDNTQNNASFEKCKGNTSEEAGEGPHAYTRRKRRLRAGEVAKLYKTRASELCKSYFHPELEHRFWCLWRIQTSDSKHESDPKKGWKFVMKDVSEALRLQSGSAELESEENEISVHASGSVPEVCSSVEPDGQVPSLNTPGPQQEQLNRTVHNRVLSGDRTFTRSGRKIQPPKKMNL